MGNVLENTESPSNFATITAAAINGHLQMEFTDQNTLQVGGSTYSSPTPIRRHRLRRSRSRRSTQQRVTG